MQSMLSISIARALTREFFRQLVKIATCYTCNTDLPLPELLLRQSVAQVRPIRLGGRILLHPILFSPGFQPYFFSFVAISVANFP